MIRVIDIETTGIDPAADAIIEIASVDMLRGGGITNAMDTLVRPGKPIPPGASAIHHIIDEDLKDAPAFSEVIDRFRGADAYVAHNCEFESSFFAAQGIELGPWICTYKCALRVWPELDGHSNQELRYALGRATPFPGFERGTISEVRPRTSGVPSPNADALFFAAYRKRCCRGACAPRLVRISLKCYRGLLMITCLEPLPPGWGCLFCAP
jgi:hypothetical protein